MIKYWLIHTLKNSFKVKVLYPNATKEYMNNLYSNSTNVLISGFLLKQIFFLLQVGYSLFEHIQKST